MVAIPAVLQDCRLQHSIPAGAQVRDALVTAPCRDLSDQPQHPRQRETHPDAFAFAADPGLVNQVIPVAIVQQTQAVLAAVVPEEVQSPEVVFPDCALALVRILDDVIQQRQVAGLA